MNNELIRPQQIGRFELGSRLDDTFIVERYVGFEAISAAAPREVEIELLKPQWATDDTLRRLYLEEATKARKLAHPNLPLHREVLVKGSHCGLVADAMAGQPLSTVWGRMNSDQISLPLRLHIICEVLGALEHAQEQSQQSPSLCHGNVAPRSIWLGKRGQVLLRGLGFSRSAALVSKQLGHSTYDLGYAAPELLRGSAANSRVDTYSTGVLLWESIAGRRRVFKDNSAAVICQRLAGQEPDIESIAPNAPGRLVAICRQALAIDPNSRYQCIGEFREDLMGFLEDVHGEDRGVQRDELVRLLRRAASSKTSRAATETRRLPLRRSKSKSKSKSKFQALNTSPAESPTKPLPRPFAGPPTTGLPTTGPPTAGLPTTGPPSAGPPTTTCPTQPSMRPARPPTVQSALRASMPSQGPERSEPDTAGHAVFSGTSRTLRSTGPLVRWALPGLLVLLICVLFSVRSLRNRKDTDLPAKATPGSASGAASVMEFVSASAAEPAPAPPPEEPVVRPVVPAVTAPPPQPLGPPRVEVPTLRLDDLKLVGTVSRRAVQGGTREFLSEEFPTGNTTFKQSRARHRLRWRRRRGKPARPIDETDPYED